MQLGCTSWAALTSAVRPLPGQVGGTGDASAQSACAGVSWHGAGWALSLLGATAAFLLSVSNGRKHTDSVPKPGSSLHAQRAAPDPGGQGRAWRGQRSFTAVHPDLRTVTGCWASHRHLMQRPQGHRFRLNCHKERQLQREGAGIKI